MKQEFKVENGDVYVVLSGGVYAEEAAVLREKLFDYVQDGLKNFLIDMNDVSYIDSSGLGVLVAVQKRAMQMGGEVVLCGLNGVVKEMFELTRLNRVFTVKEETH